MEFKEAFREIKRALDGARSDYEQALARIDSSAARQVQQAQSLTVKKDELIKRCNELERYLKRIEPYAAGYRRLQRAVPADMQRIRALWLQVDMESHSDSTAIEIAQMLYEGINDVKRQLDGIDHSGACNEPMRRAQQMRKAAAESYEAACRRIIDSRQMQEMAAAIRKHHSLADVSSLANGTAKIPQGVTIAPFVKVQGALRVAPGCEEALSARLSPYAPGGTSVFLPQRATQLIVMETTNQSETQRALAAMRTFALTVLLHMKPISQRVTFLDAVRRDDQALGEFAFMGGKEGFCPAAPRTQAELTQALRMLWHLQEKKPEQRFLFVRGYPGGFNQEGRERIRQIIDARNDKRICVILIDESTAARGSHIEQGNPHVLRLAVEGEKLFRITVDGRRIPAEFYEGINMVHPAAAKRFEAAYQQRKKNMLYMDYFKQTAPIRYRRSIDQPMSLPYGVNENGEVQYLTFEDLDFSAYLLGQSGSGKSTLFHTLIAGIVNKFHPDDAELWLADLGKTEFARYASHPLPHLRCLIIDDTQETITAFILRLEAELIRRQQLCLALDVLEYKDYVKKSGKPMPRAFVIIDEFGALSTIISQEDNPNSYKCSDALVRLLKEGRKMGFCFLFANQSYISGAKGLREEARNNVGQRLAMAAPKNEKNALLDVPSSMRGADYDAVVDSVRPHQLLVHCMAKPGPFGPVNTLYLTKEHVAQRNALADELMKRLRCVSEASLTDPDSYTDKQPVIVNSIRPEKFSGRIADMRAAIDAHRKDPVSEAGDLLLFPGEPKDLSRVRKLVLSCDRTGNALLLAAQEEISTDRAGSVIRACCQSAQMQGVPVEIWAFRKSRFIAACQTDGTQIHYESKWLCSRIEKLHASLSAQQEDHRLIVLLEPEMMMEQLEDFCDCTPADMPPGDGSARDDLDRLLGQMGSRKQSEGPVGMLCELVRRGARNKGIHFLAVMTSDDGIKACGFHSASFGVQMAFRAGVAESQQFALQKAMRYVTKNTIFGVITAGDRMLFSPFDW